MHWGDGGVRGVVGRVGAAGEVQAPLCGLGVAGSDEVCRRLGGVGSGVFEGFLVEVGCVGAGFGGLGARAWGVRVDVGWWWVVLLSQGVEVSSPLLLVSVSDMPDAFL